MASIDPKSIPGWYVRIQIGHSTGENVFQLKLKVAHCQLVVSTSLLLSGLSLGQSNQFWVVQK